LVPHEALRNAVRGLGFTFKKQTDRVELFRKRGSTLRVAIRRLDLHSEAYARQILRQAGMIDSEIEEFIASTRCNVH
jgi:hypothetical protein